RELRERMAAPDHEVRIETGTQRADAVLEPEYRRRPARHQRQCVLFADARAQHLAGLPVHATRDRAVIGVQGSEHTGVEQDLRVVWCAVVRFHLERAPVAPYDGGDAARRQLRRDLVRLESVLQRLDAEAELLRKTDQGEEL